ncbi:hypothetical protein ACHAXS_000464 [Conticribra weissflogii]
MTDNSKKFRGNGSKMSAILGLALLALTFMSRESLPGNLPKSGNSQESDNYLHGRTSRYYKRGKRNNPVTFSGLNFSRSNDELAPQQLPIFLIQSSKKKVHLSTWGTIASVWNRTTQYEDLIQISQQNQTLPNIDKTKKRPIIIIHCGPKSGSTTLRKACKRELEQTCGIISKKGSTNPYAYMDTKKFYPMVRSCNNTHHFCAKNITMPNNIPVFDDIHFIHMFPFRNYDEWAKSALKQQFDRGGNVGCSKTEHLFFERNCHNSNMEIDFRKYGKTDLAMYKEYVVRRVNEKHEDHSILLYHHRELDESLTFLSTVYDIPRLKGSDGHGKLFRPEGTCDDKLLEKFHKCFSWQLTELS